MCVLLNDRVCSLNEVYALLNPLSPEMQIEDRLARGQQSCDTLKDRLVSVLLTYIEHSMGGGGGVTLASITVTVSCITSH